MGVYENFFYYFEAYLIKKQIVFQNNIAEKYNKKGGIWTMLQNLRIL